MIIPINILKEANVAAHTANNTYHKQQYAKYRVMFAQPTKTLAERLYFSLERCHEYSGNIAAVQSVSFIENSEASVSHNYD